MHPLFRFDGAGGEDQGGSGHGEDPAAEPGPRGAAAAAPATHRAVRAELAAAHSLQGILWQVATFTI